MANQQAPPSAASSSRWAPQATATPPTLVFITLRIGDGHPRVASLSTQLHSLVVIRCVVFIPYRTCSSLFCVVLFIVIKDTNQLNQFILKIYWMFWNYDGNVVWRWCFDSAKVLEKACCILCPNQNIGYVPIYIGIVLYLAFFYRYMAIEDLYAGVISTDKCIDQASWTSQIKSSQNVLFLPPHISVMVDIGIGN